MLTLLATCKVAPSTNFLYGDFGGIDTGSTGRSGDGCALSIIGGDDGNGSTAGVETGLEVFGVGSMAVGAITGSTGKTPRKQKSDKNTVSLDI